MNNINEIQELELLSKKFSQKINELEKENKLLKLQEEKSTQLILGLDAKIYDSRKKVNDLTELMTQRETNHNKKLEELDNYFQNIKKLCSDIQKENEQLKIEVQNLKSGQKTADNTKNYVGLSAGLFANINSNDKQNNKDMFF